MYEIKKQIIAFNNPALKFEAQGIVLHETANPDDNAQMEHDYFNAANRQASAHFFVDNRQIIQCIETECIAWHAGRTANFRYWGIEMCHTSDPVKFAAIWNRSVWLCASLLRQIKVNVVTEDNLLSHAEVSAKWGETDHRDPISYLKQFGKTMKDFRKEVQSAMDEMNKKPVEVPQWKIDGAKFLLNMGYTTVLHDPLEIVDYGTLGKILNMDWIQRNEWVKNAVNK